MLTFSVFCGIIGIVHSDDPFELMFGYSILLQIRYYGYLFLKTLYCNFILQCATPKYTSQNVSKNYIGEEQRFRAVLTRGGVPLIIENRILFRQIR